MAYRAYEFLGVLVGFLVFDYRPGILAILCYLLGFLVFLSYVWDFLILCRYSAYYGSGFSCEICEYMYSGLLLILSLILSTMVYGWRSRSSMCCTEVGKQGFRNRRGWMGNRDYENDLNLWFEVGCENMGLRLCTYYCGGLRGQLYPRETCGILYGIVWWCVVPVLIMANRDSYFEPRLWENW